MNVYLHRRDDASRALYIDGNLQFDTRDEAVYHESLVIPALCLTSSPRSALICGGGDGLALREILRFPGIQKVTLIDCSPEIIDLARSEFREVNNASLDDSRVRILIEDALQYSLEPESEDLIVCDFTFPTTKEGALGFTVEWYEKLKGALKPGGMMAINGVSPQNTASAFACLVSTVRAAGLNTLPYRVCIPSFRDHGYGAWGFILASKLPLSIRELSQLKCPVETRQIDVSCIARGAHFSLSERRGFQNAPVNRIEKPVLQTLLLNPRASGTSRSLEVPPEFPNLLQQLEISHPYHSRSMIETLAEHVAGSLHSIDLRKLVEELTSRAKNLPKRIQEELAVLRDFLSRTVLDLDLWGNWASKLFAALILIMTIANSISPDPAFAKGHAGLGHSSFARGFSSHETFGGGTRTTESISGRGFRSGYGYGPVDIYGFHYQPRFYAYNDSSYYSSGGGASSSKYQTKQHKPLFVLDDDLLAMENGDFVVTLSESAFLVVSGGKVDLVNAADGKSLSKIYAEPKLFQSIRTEVDSQSADIEHEVGVRKDWLSWVGWSEALLPSVKADNQEYLNLRDLQRRLIQATAKLGSSSEGRSIDLPTGAVELFVGCHILADNRVELHLPGGQVQISDGKNMMSADSKSWPVPPNFKNAIVSIMKKMLMECQQDMVSDTKEIAALDADTRSTQLDLAEYQLIQSQNNYDAFYEVDYGTASMPVGQAIQLTQGDLASIQNDRLALETDYAKSMTNLARYRSALQAWSD